MGNCSDHGGAQSGDLHAALSRRSSDRSSGNPTRIDHYNIRLHGVRLDSGRDAGGYCLREDVCCYMIIGQSLHMVIKCVQACGGEHASLAPPAAKPLPVHSGAGDSFGGTHQHGADRSPEALGEAHADRVKQPTVGLERYPGRDVRVPQPGAVEVVADAVLAA
jgi:hypothetical protein